MYYDENDYILNRADCVPTLFTVCDPLYKRHAAGIVENELRRLKVDAVLRPVDFVLRPVPFDPHVYLHNSKYHAVKSIGRVCQFGIMGSCPGRPTTGIPAGFAARRGYCLRYRPHRSTGALRRSRPPAP